MTSWNQATEEKLTEDGFCEYCGKEIKAGESLWVLDGDVKCSQCRQKSIDQETN